MKYLICRNSNYNDGKYTFLADRNKTKSIWWTGHPEESIKFISKDAAIKKAKSLIYGKPFVVEYGSAEFKNILKYNQMVDHDNIIKNGDDAMGLDYLLECGDR